ncbi:hypothetical protein [Massilia scottii]|uniref:hypothetical protein n=1 Tax=Massilia scottii TaxID=3057166 RepID=UPI0027963E9F|nr:hypothetical protein [Massilia sp. CCM 9029]MDQ1833486.1 hypothetical protein [Massilia sp. CCM 9029]
MVQPDARNAGARKVDDDAMQKVAPMESEKKPFHETVAEKLIAQLKQGTAHRKTLQVLREDTYEAVHEALR